MGSAASTTNPESMRKLVRIALHCVPNHDSATDGVSVFKFSGDGVSVQQIFAGPAWTIQAAGPLMGNNGQPLVIENSGGVFDIIAGNQIDFSVSCTTAETCDVAITVTYSAQESYGSIRRRVGGAGNPVGGSFTGPAEALEIIGDHAYGYNSATLGSETKTAFEFQSGNYYNVAHIYFNFNTVGFSASAVIGFQVTMNNTMIVNAVYGGDQDRTTSTPQDTRILIPPYTKMNISWVNDDSSGIAVTMGVVGRIYRTRD